LERSIRNFIKNHIFLAISFEVARSDLAQIILQLSYLLIIHVFRRIWNYVRVKNHYEQCALLRNMYIPQLANLIEILYNLQYY